MPDEKLAIIKNPIDPESGDVVILPPLNPDVTLLHAQYAGDEGTIRMEGLSFADIEQAKAAKHVLVSCEHVVPEEMLRREPDRNCLPPFLVDAIIPTPYGAHPTGCYMFYDYDPTHLNLFKQMARDDAMFQQYLDEWVMPLATQEEYLDKVGASSLVRIKANPFIGYAPGMDRS